RNRRTEPRTGRRQTLRDPKGLEKDKLILGGAIAGTGLAATGAAYTAIGVKIACFDRSEVKKLR
ncbi:hypothetical protein, partial [Leptospira interrogans]|uniref:hypothetical protein n=1 Tax=Leptospira interrogans TaxID=173 RepID=UPI00077488CC